MIEEKDYSVTLTVRLHTTVSFAATERKRPITKADAIDNAIGMIPEGPLSLFDGFGGEFEIALPIDGEAEEL